MSLASQDRRLPLPPLGHLEGQGGGTLGGRHFEDGISHPLLIASSSLSGFASPSQIFLRFQQGEGFTWRGSFSYREGRCRARSPLSRLLQLSFHCLEGNGFLETSDWPVPSESLRRSNAVQDGVQPASSPCGVVGQLDGLHRFEGCVSSNPGASRQPSFPPVCRGWDDLPIQSSLFWSLHGSSRFHRGHGSCVSNVS